MRRRIAIGAATAAICLALPAGAAADHFAWQDDGANAGTTSFEDVAAGTTAVVAVGSNGNMPVIYRRAAGAWRLDTLSLPGDTTAGTLVDVAVGDNAAWAVGTYEDAAGETQPLVAKLLGANLAAGGSETWTRIEADLPAGLTAPLSVALSGDHVLIGAADGKVFPATGGTFRSAISPADGSARAVNGLAVHSADSTSPDTVRALAGTAAPNGGSGNVIYNVSASQTEALSTMTAPVPPAAAGVDVVSIASDRIRAYGIEAGTDANAPQIWAYNSGSTTPAWSRESPNELTSSSRLDAVDVVGGQAAVAGKQGTDGAIWRRSGSGAWMPPHIVTDSPLTGVAVVSASDLWAVGANGTVLRYAPAPHEQEEEDPPPPPNTTITSGPSGATTDPNVTFTFTAHQAPANFECSLDNGAFAPCGSPHTYSNLPDGGHVFAVRARNATGVDPTPARREFAVSRPAPPPQEEQSEPRPIGGGGGGESKHGGEGTRQCKPAPRKLAKKVRVKVKRKKIRIRFKLKRKAKVRAVAKRRGKVVGKQRKKIFKRGHQKVKFKVKKKPKTIRLIVKPAKKCR